MKIIPAEPGIGFCQPSAGFGGLPIYNRGSYMYTRLSGIWDE